MVERKRRKTTEGGSECEGRHECAKEVNHAYIIIIIYYASPGAGEG